MASSVSKILVAVVVAPSGKPITVQTNTPESFNRSAAYFTCVGFTQIDLKLYSLASSIIDRFVDV